MNSVCQDLAREREREMSPVPGPLLSLFLLLAPGSGDARQLVRDSRGRLIQSDWEMLRNQCKELLATTNMYRM